MRRSRVGNALRQFRQSAGFLQQELADRAAITRQALSALESGNASPSVTVALRLARVLGGQVEDLFWIEDSRRGCKSSWSRTKPGRIRDNRVAWRSPRSVDDGWAAAFPENRPTRV
jgi:DNA-binding XRE family transcriptional regulator